MAHLIEAEKDVKLYVEDIGEGRPVIFIHGWPVNHKMFEYQSTELVENGYRFIGIDLRGYGKSDKPASGYDYDRMADDVKAVIDELNLEDAVLAGFSMGGPISIRYMTRHKGKGISKLLLIAPAAPAFTQREDYSVGMKPEEVDDLIGGLRDDRPAALRNFGEMFFDSEVNVSDAYAQYFHSIAMEGAPHATIQSLRSLRDEDLRNELSEINVPTSSFHGMHDQLCPFQFSEELKKGIDNLTIVSFEKSGHALFFEEKEKFNRELLSFLEA
ncbi:alpha/beta hydrolase [Alteribacter lacisalsi]|uniref:Alpha/beta hydrolase n=1 Tax=Alteribacter lacisalsi TaxID=2045244 RepID=A0A2W0HIB7_9BACI|nr:alpha/beta hydrolase [Alteribacter lacisalsi]PYZ96549.1 alpha/beta hydrolase [Alteribacter lacisalsi]